MIPILEGQTTEVVVVVHDGTAANIDVEAPETPAVSAKGDPKAKTSTVKGRVLSQLDQTPIANARLFSRGTQADARSDPSGAFELLLPSGAQQIIVIHPQFATKTVSVEVPRAGSFSLSVLMEPQATRVAEIVVLIPKPDYGSTASQFELRKKSSSVFDAIAAEDIRKTPDSTASTATRRIVGASVVGGQFLFVRGLGGRYTNVRLNGVPLPSTDPDLPGFQIDLFPVNLLDSLQVVKTFVPDIPGDFAGGTMNIRTKDFPKELTVATSLSLKYNTTTSDWFRC